MAENSNAPLDQQSLRRLIEATIAAAGETDPAMLPHVVRRRLEGQVSGRVDLDQTIQDVLQDLSKT